MKIIERIKKWFIDQKIKNYKLKKGLMQQVSKVHKEATGKTLKGKEVELMRTRIKRTSYFANQMIKTMCFIYNTYGPKDSMGVITNIVSDYIRNTVKPDGVDNFFNYLKGAVKGVSPKQMKDALEGKKENKVRSYIG